MWTQKDNGSAVRSFRRDHCTAAQLCSRRPLCQKITATAIHTVQMKSVIDAIKQRDTEWYLTQKSGAGANKLINIAFLILKKKLLLSEMFHCLIWWVILFTQSQNDL